MAESPGKMDRTVPAAAPKENLPAPRLLARGRVLD